MSAAQTPQRQLGAASADLLEPDTGRAKLTVSVVSLSVLAGVVWSMFAYVPQVATGIGQVVPEQHVQTIQNLDGGVVEEILAKPGDRVAEGAVIAKLDPIYSSAPRDEAAQQLAGLQASAVRLQAQLDILEQLAQTTVPETGSTQAEAPAGDDPSKRRRLISSAEIALAAPVFNIPFPEDIKQAQPSLVRENTSQFEAALQELVATISVLEEQVNQKQLEKKAALVQLSTVKTAAEIASADFAALQRLAKSGAAGKAEVNAARGRYNELRGQVQQLELAIPRANSAITQLNAQIDERIGNFRARSAEQLNEVQLRVSTLKAQMPALDRRSENTLVVASSSGVIKSMAVTSKGQVVKPGESIAEIVPTDSPLLIQVKVKPEDIAFISQGMPALIKLTAYDFSIFGALGGTVERIATDSTTDERGAIYYLVDVKSLADHIERKGEVWPVKVGMVASVDIVTGKQSIFQYFTKPIHRMTQSALRER